MDIRVICAATIGALVATGCGGSSGTSAHSSTAVSATGSLGSTGSSSTGSGTGTATGAAATGSSSGASTSGGPFAGCTQGFAFSNGACLATSCPTSLTNSPCALPDGGPGFCGGGACLASSLQSDPQNCGTYGTVCPSDTTCVEGACVTDGGQSSACLSGACSAGRACDVSCLLVSCGTSDDGQPCVNNAGPGSCCGGSCVDFESSDDNANCGSCGATCPPGSNCNDGTCYVTSCGVNEPYGTSCLVSPGEVGVCCGVLCVDTSFDPGNCGGCGVACAATATCSNGSCSAVCQSSADCYAGASCVEGACLSNSCDGESDGFDCAFANDAGQLGLGACCGNVCTSVFLDPQNCGACGSACGAGQSCFDGSCVSIVLSCSTSLDNSLCLGDGLFGRCCGGVCNTGDDNNCGVCGETCPLGAHCSGGNFNFNCLVATDGGVPTGAYCDAGCPTGTACFDSQRCLPTSCAEASSAGDLCAIDGGLGYCCAGACVDESHDVANCGGCRIQCPEGFVCNSECIPADGGAVAPCAQQSCPTGQFCAAQGRECAPASCAHINDGEACAFGGAGIPGQSTMGVCCSGQCVDTNQDPANCGGCGYACTSGVCPLAAGSSTGCTPTANPSGNTCAVSCPAGSDCIDYTCEAIYCTSAGTVCVNPEGQAGICCGFGSPCVDAATDPQNCGGCGFACAAGQTCQGGVCSGLAAPCDAPGKLGAFCNLDGGPGFVCCPGIGCTDTSTDPNDCGGCGVTCSTNACLAGQCVTI